MKVLEDDPAFNAGRGAVFTYDGTNELDASIMEGATRRAGAVVQRDGSESEAYLSMPQATLDSQLNGLMQEQMAELDYQLKMQAHQFRQWLDTVQKIRQGVRDARHNSRGP